MTALWLEQDIRHLQRMSESWRSLALTVFGISLIVWIGVILSPIKYPLIIGGVVLLIVGIVAGRRSTRLALHAQELRFAEAVRTCRHLQLFQPDAD